jgi:hypothetical protein
MTTGGPTVMRLTRSNIPDEIKSLDGLTDRHATRPIYRLLRLRLVL